MGMLKNTIVRTANTRTMYRKVVRMKMTREPETRGTEEMLNTSRKFFFAVEHTGETSPIDVDDFCILLSAICERYNMKWCQCVWREKDMQRLDKKKQSQR